MKRKIITIDEDLCNGCANCIPNCPEGALQVIDGKARLISDLFCDGLGACIGYCPTGAMKISEREAQKYDETKVMVNIIKAGPNTIKAHLTHLKEHGESGYLKEAIEVLRNKKIPIPVLEEGCHGGGCPGSKMLDLRNNPAANPSQKKQAGSDLNMESELRQWPVQMKLVNPNAPYFKDSDLVVAADCVPFAYPAFHDKFLKGKSLIILCPKLDDSYEEYVDKLAEIIKNGIKSITVVHMEVPCCFGTNKIVDDAIEASKKGVKVKEYTITIQGEIKVE